MKNLVLAGAGGCMRELVWQIQELNKACPLWNIIGYVDFEQPEEEVYVGGQHIPYLGSDDTIINCDEEVNVAICVGSPILRRKIVSKYQENKNIKFPNLILSNTCVCEDVKMGQGCIISMDVRISTNVRMGNFVFMNTGAMVCHDGELSDYVTLGPDVKLAGNVQVGTASTIGLGAKVIQGITIAEDVVIGAGAVVVRDIEEKCKVVGVPAKAIR